MINLEIEAGFSSQVDSNIIERAAQTALDHQAVPLNVELTIVITDDENIQKLNQEYRGIDAPTDVLSFQADFTDPENQAQYLGDIIISYPRAVQQAEEHGNPVEDELQLLVVHGVLHILGHDHAKSDEKTRMWNAQGAILDILGVENFHRGSNR